MAFSPSDEQKRIIACTSPIMVLNAPHGTGKTKTEAYFIRRQLQREKYKRIVVVTLTNSAARSMSRAVERALGTTEIDPELMVVGTFHRFARSILHQHARLVGFAPDFTIDPYITRRLLQRLIKAKQRRFTSWDHPLRTLTEIHTKHVRRGSSLTEIAREALSGKKDIALARSILQQVESLKKRYQVMDFDDLILYLWELFRHHPAVLRRLVVEHRLMVVDEFQDITRIQWKIIRSMVSRGMHLLAAGDECQTLYRFAEASPQRFNQLRALPGCRELPLTRNFRTTKPIINLGNAILSQRSTFRKRRVWSSKRGPKPKVILSSDKRLLVAGILKKIAYHVDQGVRLDGIAILFRFDRDARYLTSQLQKHNYPYIFYSKSPERARASLGEFIASLVSIVKNRKDKEAWKRLLAHVKGIGPVKSRKVISWLRQRDYLYSRLQDDESANFTADLNALFALIREVASLQRKPREALDVVLQHYAALKKRGSGRKLQKIVVTSLQYLAKTARDIHEMMDDYHERPFDVWLERTGTDKPAPLLVLSNIHQAKGDEFEVVFVLGSDDRPFKKFGTFKNPKTVDDEIMVMLTAVTRSRRYLYLMFPMTPKEWKRKKHRTNPSIFIRNSPDNSYHKYSVEWLGGTSPGSSDVHVREP